VAHRDKLLDTLRPPTVRSNVATEEAGPFVLPILRAECPSGGSSVANTRSAIKRMKQSEKRRVRNRAIRSKVRSVVKSARAAMEDKSAPSGTDATTAVRDAIRALDRAVGQGVIHRNTAARRKSALARKLVSPR